MLDCVLRVSGSKEKIKRFLAASSFEPAIIFFEGERKSANRTWQSSGFNLVLSSSDGIEKQAAGAVRFIKRHKDEFERMKRFGFKTSTIDFGLYDATTEDHPWPSYRLPKSLIALAAEYGFAIDLSFYGRA